MPLAERDYMRAKQRNRKPYSVFGKLLLNLSLLALLGFLIWWGIRLFIHELEPLFGSIIFIVGIVAFIGICKLLSKAKRQPPSMKLSIFCLIALFLITAFAGVQPMSGYKDIALGRLSSWWSNQGTTGNQFSGVPLSTSTGPVDIQANVVIAEGLRIADNNQFVYTKVSNDTHVSWIVDISLRNNSYKNSVSGNSGSWLLVTSGNTYVPSGFVKYVPPALNVALGQTGSTTLRFYVPRSLKVGDAQVKYQGEEPNSYTSVSGNNTVVALYDINKKAAIDTNAYLRVVDIWGIDLGLFGATILVQLESTSTTQIGRYDVTLSADKESFGTKIINWTKGQELAKVEWYLDLTARPLAELARGKTCKEVFQVKIAFNPY